MILVQAITTLDLDGHSVTSFEPVLNRQTNEPVVTETRAPAKWRALPRAVRDRIVGNPDKGIVGLETSKKFLVKYQDFAEKYVSGVRCWKCGTLIVSWAPTLRLPDGARTDAEAQLTTRMVNGQAMILASLLPLNHYREGLCAYRNAEGRMGAFSYLHCADCSLASSDGDDLLACHLAGFDAQREFFKTFSPVISDDDHAQNMFRWSGVEIVGLDGPSLGPKELMEQAATGRG